MLPRIFARLALGIIFFISSKVVASPILQIFCKTRIETEFSKLSTFPSNASQNYFSPDVTFTDEKNEPFFTIFDYQPYLGDDLKVQLIIRAQQINGKISIYRSLAHIGRRLAKSEWLASSRKLNQEIEERLIQRGLGTSLMARHENTLILAGEASDEFIIYDLISQSRRSVRLQENLANPRFSLSGSNVIFDLFHKKSSRWRQVAYNLNTLNVSFITPVANLDHSSLEFNPARKNWIWLELDPKSEAAALVESSAASTNILTKINASVGLPLIYSLDPSGLKVFWTEHSYQPGRNPNGSPKNIFSVARARSLFFQGTSLNFVNWLYPESFLSLLNDHVPKRLMSGGFKTPNSDQLYFSLDILKGLISLNTQSGQWTLIARSQSCFQPQWFFQGIIK